MSNSLAAVLTQPGKEELLSQCRQHGLTTDRMQQLIAQPQTVEQLPLAALVAWLNLCNHCYRQGMPLVSDPVYDRIFLDCLAKKEPQHPFLHQVEPDHRAKHVTLPQRMLSTEKAYHMTEIEQWLQRLHKINADSSKPIMLQVTAKLDGYAAYDDGYRLYSRGDGRRGSDISYLEARGLTIAGPRGKGPGEIVVSKSYFQQHLSKRYQNTRNVLGAVLAEKNLDPLIEQSLQREAVIFLPFSQLPAWRGDDKTLLLSLDKLFAQQRDSLDYDTDGIIIESTDPQLKQQAGSTRHHHRWQIAYKVNHDAKSVKVCQVLAQTSRTGRVNPVVLVEPVRLSGATIQRVTGHHFGLVKQQGIGPGAEILLVRSGQVIPKIEGVVHGVAAEIPTHCPCCDEKLLWQGDFLCCVNITHCQAQLAHSLGHFFRCLPGVDGFGPKTIAKLLQAGFNDLLSIYNCDYNALRHAGFADKTSRNLLAQLAFSQTEPLEDWRFLQALGVPHLGAGNSERLLQHMPLHDLCHQSVESIAAIEGFAETSAKAIVMALHICQDQLEGLSQRFHLIASRRAAKSVLPLSGYRLVFTGTLSNDRHTLQNQAKQLGAQVSSQISNKTDYLIVGERAGRGKLEQAKQLGVTLLNETNYRQWLEEQSNKKSPQ